MAGYYANRLIWLFISWMFICLLTFGLSKLPPGDPVDYYLSGQDASQLNRSGGPKAVDREYASAEDLLGLNQPNFYFSILPAAFPDTLHRIPNQARRKAICSWLKFSGNWNLVSNFYYTLLDIHHLPIASDSTGVSDPGWRRSVSLLLVETSTDKVDQTILTWRKKVQSNSTRTHSGQEIDLVYQRWRRLKENRKWIRLYFPKVIWHGPKNQFHPWLFGFFSGNMGISTLDGRPVRKKIGEAIPWTLILNGAAIFFSLILAIGSGAFMGTQKGSLGEKGLSLFYFLAYAIPSFWLGTLLLILFTSPDYGMKWFPALGPVHLYREGESFFSTIYRLTSHFFLPVLCLTLGALAFLSRQVRNSFIQIKEREYILAARARGISSSRIIWKHMFRNTLFPIITLIAGLIPGILAGSLVIEVIFNLHGMGMLALESIYGRDWGTLLGIVQISALLTILSLFIADLLYPWADPRVSLFQKNTV